jgi:hypothetical protein
MGKSLKAYTEQAIRAPDGQPIPTNVWLPPKIRGHLARVSHDVVITREPPNVAENMARIQAETDPVGLLIAIANGQPVGTFVVSENGDVSVEYETLTLAQRLSVIRYLSDKILPRMSVSKKMPAKEGDGGSWEAVVTNAGGRS